MLSFATEFPVDNGRSSTDFLRAVQAWILGSPHTLLKQKNLEELLAPRESHIQVANERIDTLRFASSDQDAAGVVYSRCDNGLDWTTNIVFSRAKSDSWVGIRVSCESRHPAARLPPAKKPVLVRTLLNELGGASDGLLRVGNKPHCLDNVDIDLAARLITGKAGCRLPVVYVSAGFHGSYILDSADLARELAGMAHVVVEPNRPFSLRLKIEVGSANSYGGTIGVYWPDGGGRRSFFIGRQFESPEELARAVFEEIRTALTNRRAFERCTWSYVQERTSRQAFEALRASGSKQVNEYIKTFDADIDAKNQRLADAEREINRLRAELRIYEARLPIGSASLLQTGNEQDLYPNELLGITYAAVDDACKRAPEDSRRKHVLASILQANPLGEDYAGSMRERLKQLLRGSRGMDQKTRRGLEEMGFAITEDGKHYKLVFQEDDRYTFTLSKTGSDHRGGLNAASDMGRRLF
jgi:hypothetical protein